MQSLKKIFTSKTTWVGFGMLIAPVLFLFHVVDAKTVAAASAVVGAVGFILTQDQDISNKSNGGK